MNDRDERMEKLMTHPFDYEIPCKVRSWCCHTPLKQGFVSPYVQSFVYQAAAERSGELKLRKSELA
ncbi:hypothetical protein MKC66_15745 [[Clostridium] innocuum]|nr:hypothetical protein [[Clostridium] innocuum]MCR0328899.1 hypothetical protein [[Clostridium] innocuum]